MSYGKIKSEDWSYSGATGGPEHWSEIAPDANGHRQSPIDLDPVVRAELEPIRFDYGAHVTDIAHTGHSIELRFTSGATFAADGRVFRLDNLHFHAPAEHRVASKPFALEAHFVNVDDAGHIAVVALLYRIGVADPTLAKIGTKLNLQPQERRPLDGKLAAVDFLPPDHNYFFYSGSLTTPPCTEGVDWFILIPQLTVSKDQVEKLMHVVGGPNNRPLQERNGRKILVQRQE